MKEHWIIYGANGYTGRMIAILAIEKGFKPILAGRNENEIRKLANELGLPARVFSLDDPQVVRGNLVDCVLVLHCAGPFEKTCPPMIEAALQAGCHYLDISGEIPVYEYLKGLDKRAQNANTMMLPGVGFDVVPTDCMASRLKKTMPDAATLELAFFGEVEPSTGSFKTVLQQMPHGSKIRVNDKIKTVPLFDKNRQVEVNGTRQRVYSIPWGDIATAHVSTQIPNITVYTSFPEVQATLGRAAQPLVGLLKNNAILKGAEMLVDALMTNPAADHLANGYCYIWGEVSNAAGRKESATFKTIETYSFTAESSLLCIQKILDGTVEGGFQTPSIIFGSELVFEVRGTRLIP